MSSADLPGRPHLDQLRRQAKELKRAALAGDPAALARLRGFLPPGVPVTLAVAQLAVAREYGFASWAGLTTGIRAHAAEVAERVDEFLHRSVVGSPGAMRLLAADPVMATYDIRTAAVLGDVATARRLIAADPEVAVRPDERRSGWPPLLFACMSRWHQLVVPDPDAGPEEMVHRVRERATGMVEVARLLLDAGADPNTTVGGRPGDAGFCSPLFAAAGCANHPALTALLLDRGARPDDHTVYLAAFHASRERSAPGTRKHIRVPPNHDCLRLLLRHYELPADSTALAAPISLGDVEGARLMLNAGADPNRPLPAALFGEEEGGQPPLPPVHAAVRFGSSPAMLRLLLDRGADPNGRGPDGQSPYRLALRLGRADAANLLLRLGAREHTSSAVDGFLSACARGDRAAAETMSHAHPGIVRRLTDHDRRVLVEASERGNTEAVQLMLDLGFPADQRGGPDAVTALHAAAHSGSAQVVGVLIRAGADLEARDRGRNASPLGWAVLGSARRLGHNPDPDWVATVRTLLDAGADPAHAWSGDEFPGKDVARLLVQRGIDIPGKDPAAMRHALGLDPEQPRA
ncbi:MAG TPA: ankyrin repeat domain-containing protein [Candidatus Limnocylindrales bacterium]